MRRKLELVFGVISIAIVLFAIIYITFSVIVFKGPYSYHEIELRTTDENIEFALIIPHENMWEKQINEPIGIYQKDINVYYLKDDVIITYELKVRETTIYQIGDKYYYRMNLLQIAF